MNSAKCIGCPLNPAKCSGCPDYDQCSLDGLFDKIINSKYVSDPKEKVSIYKAALMEKGGFKAYFNPGVSYQDANNGIFMKSLLIVEDKNDLRMDLINMLRPTVFRVYAASTYEDALKLIEDRETLKYALLDDMVPEARGKELGNFADQLYDKVTEKFPEARVFAYPENVVGLEKSYLGKVEKGDNSLRDVYNMLIEDSELIVDGKYGYNNDCKDKNDDEDKSDNPDDNDDEDNGEEK